ncbi:MAG TPA: cupredoxin domain-containing protein [Trueperaceae bacterium]|nr:cupredoxin domain-containing protein [Trueperaceae bacterium]
MSKVLRYVLASIVALSFATGFAQDEQTPTVEYTLVGQIGTQGFEFVGVGGDIDGVRNPELTASVGDVVKVTVISADGMQHDFAIPDLGVDSELTTGAGEEGAVSVVFEVTQAGTFTYLCTVPGHAVPDAGFGMFGDFVVSE